MTKKLSDSHREAIRKAQTGRKKSQAEITKISRSLMRYHAPAVRVTYALEAGTVSG